MNLKNNNKTIAIGITILILSEALMVLLMFLTPTWKPHVISFYEPIYNPEIILEKRIILFCKFSFFFSSICGLILLMLSSNSFKYIIKVWGLTLLITPILLEIINIFINTKIHITISSVLNFLTLWWAIGLFFTIPFLILLLFVGKTINKEICSVLRKKIYIGTIFSVIIALIFLPDFIHNVKYFYIMLIYIVIGIGNTAFHKLKPESE